MGRTISVSAYIGDIDVNIDLDDIKESLKDELEDGGAVEVLRKLITFKDHPLLIDPLSELYDIHLVALDAEIYLKSLA